MITLKLTAVQAHELRYKMEVSEDNREILDPEELEEEEHQRDKRVCDSLMPRVDGESPVVLEVTVEEAKWIAEELELFASRELDAFKWDGNMQALATERSLRLVVEQCDKAIEAHSPWPEAPEAQEAPEAPKTKAITLHIEGDTWMATYEVDGNPDPETVRLFGGATIPTAFTNRAPVEKVRATLEELNEGWEVRTEPVYIGTNLSPETLKRASIEELQTALAEKERMDLSMPSLYRQCDMSSIRSELIRRGVIEAPEPHKPSPFILWSWTGDKPEFAAEDGGVTTDRSKAKEFPTGDAAADYREAWSFDGGQDFAIHTVLEALTAIEEVADEIDEIRAEEQEALPAL